VTFVKPNNRLYHYRTFEVFVKYIAPELKLRLNSINKTNDPRENKHFNFASTSKKTIPNLLNSNKKVSKILRQDCKVLCFSDDNVNYHGYEMSRMWAYYGENHKGICLEIDKHEFINENKEFINPNLLRKIRYKQQRVHSEQKFINVDYTNIKKGELEKYLKTTFRRKHLKHLFFTKNKEWQSEEEIRLIHFSNEIKDEYCSIKNSLKKIYLGVDFDEKKIPILIKLCPNVNIYKLEYAEYRMIPRLRHEGN